MAWIHPAAVEDRRKRFTRPDGARFLRPDAYRFAAPGTPEAEMPGWLDPSATRVRLQEAQEAEAAAAHAAEIQALYAEHLKLRHELAELKFELAWRRLCRKTATTRVSRADSGAIPRGRDGG